MTDHTTKFTRAHWIDAARTALIKRGIEGVKVDRLAKTLKVTRGSFYHHFAGRATLLDALLHDWEVRNTVELAQIRDRWESAAPDLSEVVRIWVSEDPNVPAFDMAVRLWARQSSSVAKAVRRIDNAWIEILTGLFAQAGYSEDEQRVRARIIYYHQIGYYALDVQESRTERLRLLPVYYRALTGAEPGTALDDVLASLGGR